MNKTRDSKEIFGTFSTSAPEWAREGNTSTVEAANRSRTLGIRLAHETGMTPVRGRALYSDTQLTAIHTVQRDKTLESRLIAVRLVHGDERQVQYGSSYWDRAKHARLTMSTLEAAVADDLDVGFRLVREGGLDE